MAWCVASVRITRFYAQHNVDEEGSEELNDVRERYMCNNKKETGQGSLPPKGMGFSTPKSGIGTVLIQNGKAKTMQARVTPSRATRVPGSETRRSQCQVDELEKRASKRWRQATAGFRCSAKENEMTESSIAKRTRRSMIDMEATRNRRGTCTLLGKTWIESVSFAAGR
jgi:hypothetical protein